ncbi:uncharacterized protein BDR25DRAFT_353701 [Lindgomyces ingoldianus]|uniref:Uncharacterized protein n=1 Tax=Lindgomyces ingoldianus TaxID=673940 RepID=A0ACB6R091_9PLEO|nr:uncharacterized protein BDR25DRAFT_353701 [Lindgomyces ingoldianus]KAF2471927.1 hypothetical protein BDR25DRAFT_353701 [Lindgomyces ingoldianus]
MLSLSSAAEMLSYLCVCIRSVFAWNTLPSCLFQIYIFFTCAEFEREERGGGGGYDASFIVEAQRSPPPLFAKKFHSMMRPKSARLCSDRKNRDLWNRNPKESGDESKLPGFQPVACQSEATSDTVFQFISNGILSQRPFLLVFGTAPTYSVRRQIHPSMVKTPVSVTPMTAHFFLSHLMADPKVTSRLCLFSSTPSSSHPSLHIDMHVINPDGVASGSLATWITAIRPQDEQFGGGPLATSSRVSHCPSADASLERICWLPLSNGLHSRETLEKQYIQLQIRSWKCLRRKILNEKSALSSSGLRGSLLLYTARGLPIPNTKFPWKDSSKETSGKNRDMRAGGDHVCVSHISQVQLPERSGRVGISGVAFSVIPKARFPPASLLLSMFWVSRLEALNVDVDAVWIHEGGCLIFHITLTVLSGAVRVRKAKAATTGQLDRTLSYRYSTSPCSFLWNVNAFYPPPFLLSSTSARPANPGISSLDSPPMLTTRIFVTILLINDPNICLARMQWPVNFETPIQRRFLRNGRSITLIKGSIVHFVPREPKSLVSQERPGYSICCSMLDKGHRGIEEMEAKNSSNETPENPVEYELNLLSL